MNTGEEVMNQPYYSAEILEKLTDDMTSFMKTEHPDGKSVFHFLGLKLQKYADDEEDE